MNHKIKSKIILLTLVLLLLLSSFCMATNTVETKSANNVNDTTEETTPEATYEFITSDVYKFDSDVVINDIIDGNVFAFGNTVSISGEIGGDVFVFGNRVKFSDNAYIHGNIFVFAQDLTFGGIAYDIYGMAGNVTLEKGSIIGRDIKISANTITIDGSVKRNAYLATSELIFPEDAKDLIAGNLHYTADSEINFNKEAVTGEVKFTPDTPSEVPLATKVAGYINKVLSALLYCLVIVLLSIWLTPKFANKTGDILKKKPLATLGLGFLATVVAIAFSVTFLLITYGLGAGISFASITAFILVLTIAKTVFAMAIAKLLASKFHLEKVYQFVLLTLAVVLVTTLLGLVPYIGWLILFIVNMYGVGIFAFNLIKKKTNENQEEIKE